MKKTTVAQCACIVVYDPIAEGGYQFIVPTLPEIITYGGTSEEARGMARDAILCDLESALKAGERIPPDLKPNTELVAISLP